MAMLTAAVIASDSRNWPPRAGCAPRAPPAPWVRSSASRAATRTTCYAAMDWVLERKQRIENALADRHLVGIVKLLTLCGGCEDWSLWRLRRGTRATGIRLRSSGTRCGCITVSVCPERGRECPV